jgi:hypothetical protein
VGTVDIPDVPLTPEDEALMLLYGFAKRDPDGVLALTDRGNEWVREWCRKRIGEAP